MNNFFNSLVDQLNISIKYIFNIINNIFKLLTFIIILSIQFISAKYNILVNIEMSTTNYETPFTY